ncbi:MAG TPA: phosphoadenosine phosphosulfate reductase family protein [Nonomuraea sp.]|nr:phosphoadenosine phosphosulfate reductase family protein [Nonomuraea sp.]
MTAPVARRPRRTATAGLAPDSGIDLATWDVLVIACSAGKDSMAMLAYLADLITRQDYRGRVVVLYNDLGTTASGQSIEWPGARQLAHEHATVFGFEFVVRRRSRGGLWQQLLQERRLWPSSQARWCTSDQKSGTSLTWITEAVEEFWQALGVPADRPVQVLYCLGLRGEESASRAAQPILAVNTRRSSRHRTITRWLPIRDWTIGQVWEQIKRSTLRPHRAYSWGMSRLSCSMCVLGSMDDLLLAAALRPQMAADYHEAEIQLGHRFHAQAVHGRDPRRPASRPPGSRGRSRCRRRQGPAVADGPQPHRRRPQPGRARQGRPTLDPAADQ